MESLPPRHAAVHAAISRGDADALRRALANGGSPNIYDPNTYGIAPLMRVCWAGQNAPELVAILLAAGADVNAIHGNNLSPLSEAVNKGKLACIRVLVAGGASLTQECSGLTPVEWMSASANCRRVLPLMLRLGSPLPRLEAQAHGRTRRWMRYGQTPFDEIFYQILLAYRNKVAAAGSWAAYERQHRARLARTFVPKFPRLPPDVIPTIVAFGFHTGDY